MVIASAGIFNERRRIGLGNTERPCVCVCVRYQAITHNSNKTKKANKVRQASRIVAERGL